MTATSTDVFEMFEELRNRGITCATCLYGRVKQPVEMWDEKMDDSFGRECSLTAEPVGNRHLCDWWRGKRKEPDYEAY